jgi:predicted enzyme related to lactoylglutathione lyase
MELQSDDPAAAAAFYAAVVGVGTDTMPAGDSTYYRLLGPEGASAGISAKTFPGVPSIWLPWVFVDSADAALARAVAAGGEVVAPAFDVEGIGRMGLLRDDQGALLGVIVPTAMG